MNALVPIDSNLLDNVTGGKTSSSGIDSLISQLNGLKSSISDIKNKTSGFSQTEMLVLCMLALQQRPSNVVVVKRKGYWF